MTNITKASELNIVKRLLQLLPHEITSRLPRGRNLNVHDDCPILVDNNTLIEGWNGIPENIFINLLATAIFIIFFLVLLLYVSKTNSKNRRNKTSNTSNFLQFIYGEKTDTEAILYSIQTTDRNDPKAFVPIFLYDYSERINRQFIIDQLEISPPKDQEPISIVSPIEEKSIATDSPGSDDKSIRSSFDEISVRSTILSGDEKDEKKLKEHLKAVLWDGLKKEPSRSLSKIVIDKPIAQDDRKSFFEWLSSLVIIKDEDILRRKGFDAVQYLIFQRYIIYFLSCVTVISILIILPINLVVGKRLIDREKAYYKKTTLLNINNNSKVIYIHAIMTLVIVIAGIFMMRRFSAMIFKKDTYDDKRILLIKNIPKLKRNANQLKDFLETKFSDILMKQIVLVCDITHLLALMKRLWTAIEAKHYCQSYERRFGCLCEVRPYFLGHFLGFGGLCLCFPKVDGVSHYNKEKLELDRKVEQEKRNITQTPTDMVFFVFDSEWMATEVYNYYHTHCYIISWLIHLVCGHQKDSFNSWQWYVQYAPAPDDIQWDDMGKSKKRTWFISITMNTLIIILFVFISTPNSAIKIFQATTKMNEVTDDMTERSSDWFVRLILLPFFPTFLLMAMTTILPAIIKGLTVVIPYKTKSEYNHDVMYKTYIFLLLMVLILPSLVIETGFKLVINLFAGDAKSIKLDCMFPAENGAFFTNYIISSAFFGNLFELSRLGEVGIYLFWLLLISRSPAEYLRARQMTKFEFYFGTYYPKVLLIVTLIVTFSICSPLIAPIGLFYMVVKHLVDRYLIYNVYIVTKIDQRVHSKAVLFVYVSLLFLLIQVFTHLRSMKDNYPAYIIGIVLIIHMFYTLYKLVHDLTQRFM